MEKAGARVAPPIFVHDSMPSAICDRIQAKKRGYLHHQSVREQTRQAEQLQLQLPLKDSANDWNLNSWQWDSLRFVVRPLESEILHPGVGREENKETDDSSKLSALLEQNTGRFDNVEHDDNRSILNLGGGMKFAEESASRPNKKIRSGSPGDTYPICQVDDCNEDLSNVKDYHRRHKVCEVHSKSTNALVGNQMQRFCQQCSRFHLLLEFDEGKRSCRRRLAGHNRRRRKTQSEDVDSSLSGQGNQVCNTNENVDIVHLLHSLASGQGKAEVNGLPGLEREQIVNFLGKIHSLKLPVDLATKLQSYRNDKAGDSLGKSLLNHQDRFNPNSSTADLLAVFSSMRAAPASNDTVAVHSQIGETCGPERNNKSKSSNESIDTLPEKGTAVDRSSVAGERSSTSYQSPVEDSDGQIQQTHPSLQLQLFTFSPEDDSPPKSASSKKYFSSEGSNPVDEQSPSSSPVIQELFPMQSLREAAVSERRMMSSGIKENGDVRFDGRVMPLDLFRDSERVSDDANAQNRTGRIMFKLFNKDPSHLPGALRSQIHNWLWNSPSDMESYIRPGCVVLSLYVSMPSSSWAQLEANLMERLYMLLQSSDCEFWRSGRLLVYSGRKLASHKDGRFFQSKSNSTYWPELISVSPLAVVGGQETSLVLRGRNMNSPETKSYCTLTSGYMTLEVSKLSSPTSSMDEIIVNKFKVQTDFPTGLGRCFVEVENGFRGSSFPVIIADAVICNELRLFESELDGDSAQVLHFLNELGWLFQRKPNAPLIQTPEVSLGRYQYLLTFAVERDSCALVEKILDLSLENCLNGNIPLAVSLAALSEIHLLNRAVRRQCCNMVDLLINFHIDDDGTSSRTYLFTPDTTGPGGVTPLHAAASTSGSFDIVDALTNDPQEIGLNVWSSSLDANGLSPHAYATLSNNHSYNELVSRKLANKEKGQISLTITRETTQDRCSNRRLGLEVRSCARCAARGIHARPRGVLHRPYMYSVLVIASVCVCVCLLNRTAPRVGILAPFVWENVDFGTI